MAKPKVHLLVIDPQNDFCDLPEAYLAADPKLPGAHLQPALPVPGAHADMQRLSEFIRRGASAISEISVTLDSHQHLDIAHPTFWKQGNGDAVQPFTQIAASDVRAGRYLPKLPDALARTLSYLDALEAAGRYLHMVWPVHCEIGSFGHAVHHDVRLAYNQWEDATLRSVAKITKGENPWTEHFSAIMAEVPDPRDPSTELNRALLERLEQSDLIFIAGEAGSHCVKATTEHIVDNIDLERVKLVLITDCMSPVSGFESHYAAFLNQMRARGSRLATSTELVAEFF